MGGSRVRAPFGWDAAAAAEEIGGKEGGRRAQNLISCIAIVFKLRLHTGGMVYKHMEKSLLSYVHYNYR